MTKAEERRMCTQILSDAIECYNILRPRQRTKVLRDMYTTEDTCYIYGFRGTHLVYLFRRHDRTFYDFRSVWDPDRLYATQEEYMVLARETGCGMSHCWYTLGFN